MKKRFIFDEDYNKRNSKVNLKWLILAVVFLVIIVIVILLVLANKDNFKRKPEPAKPIYNLKETLTIQSGSLLPNVEDYFTELSNVDKKSIKVTYPDEFEVNYDNSNCTPDEINKINNTKEYDEEIYKCTKKTLVKPMTYGVVVSLLDKEFTVKLIVEDTVAPDLVVKDLEIYEGSKYSARDFLESCNDVTNSCEVSFYTEDKDENGNLIDYSKYTSVGKYTVKIVGKDNSGNVSEPKTANINIKKVDESLLTVTFNSQGGSKVDSVRVESGKKISEPKAPTRAGYKFLGWYLGNNKFNFNTSINSNTNLVAKWEKLNTESPGPDPGVIEVSSISVSNKTVYLYEGSNTTVKASVNPSNATNKNITWSTSNASIATVSGGKIKGIKAGTATITASAGSKSVKITVIVKKRSTTNSCRYGNTEYNKKYIMSVKLTNNNCAINPNITPNESVSSKDYQKLMNDLNRMGINITNQNFKYSLDAFKIKNTAGIGLVGYQLTVSVKINDAGKYMSATYIIQNNGSRKFISNNITKNNITLK